MNAMEADDLLLPLSGLQHFVFCRRQWALIHLEQQWQENLLTVEGALLHLIGRGKLSRIDHDIARGHITMGQAALNIGPYEPEDRTGRVRCGPP